MNLKAKEEQGESAVLQKLTQLTCLLLVVLTANTSFAVGQPAVLEYRDWSTYVLDNPSRCLAVTKAQNSQFSRNGEIVQARRGKVIIYTSASTSLADSHSFGFSPGYSVSPSNPVIMYIDGTAFELKRDTDSDLVFPRSSAENDRIIRALRKGSVAIIISQSARGTTATDMFSLYGYTRTSQEASSSCYEETNQASKPSVAKVTPGGGAVSIMEIDTSERRTRGKLNGCELTYTLAFEDNIYRKGAITFLRGALNFSSFDMYPAFLFKVTAFDLQGNSAIEAPLSYAYLSSKTKSYAGIESTIVPSDDGGLLVMYPITSASSLSFLEPLTINISRKDGKTDLGIPMDVTSHDAETALKFANCAINLTTIMTKDME